jgi:hypothetical protein
MITEKNLLNDKVRFIIALENQIAGELFDNLAKAVREFFPTATGAYILNFEANDVELATVTTISGQTQAVALPNRVAYIFDLIITQESSATLQVNIICNQKEFQITDIQYELNLNAG